MGTLTQFSPQHRIGHCLAERESITECLARHIGLSGDTVRWLISFGSVYVDRKRISKDQPLNPGQYVRVHFDPKRFPVAGIDWRAAILHEDESFLVLNKPPGIPVHPTLDNGIENVVHQLADTLGKTVFVTQRLDIEVGGLLVLAKSREFQRDFNRMLAERKVQKRYRALVTSAPRVGRHVHYMQPAKRSPRRVEREPREGWLECVLRVISVRPAGDVFDAEIDLETGRTHQIRVQLSALGCAIAGDTLYGSDDAAHGIRLFCAAQSWTDERREWAFRLAPPWGQSIDS
jgi:23S rRNA pseudouridine1911/1915/1917 synthase